MYTKLIIRNSEDKLFIRVTNELGKNSPLMRQEPSLKYRYYFAWFSILKVIFMCDLISVNKAQLEFPANWASIGIFVISMTDVYHITNSLLSLLWKIMSFQVFCRWYIYMYYLYKMTKILKQCVHQ